MTGTRLKVLRIVSAMALLVVVAAGCGGAERPQRAAVHGVPRALARGWEGQASAIATAASAGDSCRALQLATSLRHDVLVSEHELPLRLRSPLLAGVNALVDRLTCTQTVTVATTPTKPPPHEKPPHKKPPPPGHHGHHGHGGDG
jgi:hypothetical protein